MWKRRNNRWAPRYSNNEIDVKVRRRIVGGTRQLKLSRGRRTSLLPGWSSCGAAFEMPSTALDGFVEENQNSREYFSVYVYLYAHILR